MSSHVVVIDSTARRAVVKVTPTKHLSDVLGEACAKLGADPAQYTLKHQKKQLDLSLSIRLAGLSSGAKLELVQLSRSPSLVSVALQLPESDAEGAPNGRLVDKFPSSTTLWLVLRKFESGVAGNGTTRNLTARATPLAADGSGAGRLFYQTPVIQVMGRELSSFVDLQRSLAQLGISSGTAGTLLRLSFRTTDRPLEDAMAEIDAYFKSIDEEPSGRSEPKPPSPVETPVSSGAGEATPASTPSNTEQLPVPSPPPELLQEQAAFRAPEQPQVHPQVSSRPVTVYAPPSGTTPQSAQMPYNETDYLPTVDHAKLHQRRLAEAGRPGRLASDSELAAQEAALRERLAKVAEIEVKVRFPDQSQVVSKFGKDDNASGLYTFVRGCLDESLANEPFSLSLFGGLARGKVVIPDSADTRLIRDLRMDGRVLVNFTWEGNAALGARSSGTAVLKADLRRAAKQIKVEDVAATAVEEDEEEKKSWLRRMAGDSERGGSARDGGGKKVPKWLKLPGKK